MLQIIRFLEEDIDGCGTDVEALIGIETDFMLTRGHTERLLAAIAETKKKITDWDTDTCINNAMEKVFEGQKYEVVYPDIEVVF